MSKQISDNAERVLLFEYVCVKGVPQGAQVEGDPKSAQMNIFGKIAGLSKEEVAAAYAECEDAGFISQVEPPRARRSSR